MAAAWDRASAEYWARRGDDVRSVSYGNIAPTEADLQLLGGLRGQRVLDFGCGGGQNAVACARMGAVVVGVDTSAEQVARATRLSQQHGQHVTWVHGAVTASTVADRAPFDLILALQVLPYVDDAAVTLRMLRDLLAPGGRLVAALDHPLRNCFYDEDTGDLSPFPVRPYGQHATLAWSFAPGVPMQMHHAPLASWIGWMVESGLEVAQVIEAPAPCDVCDELWPEDSPLAPLRLIPHTAILVGHAPQ